MSGRRLTPPTETPVLAQYRELKAGHPEGVMFFRLGDFFEIFFEDAVLAAPIMGVTLTSRPMGRAGRHPMCGVPHHAWQTYAGRLLRAGHPVVICDQVERPDRGIVRRDVTRVLTPGTVVEDAYLDANRSNYLVAAYTAGGLGGFAAVDVSTGELLLSQIPAERLPAELERLRPAELLTPPAVDAWKFDVARGRQRMRDAMGIAFEDALGAADCPLAIGALGVVLEYLAGNQLAIRPGMLRARTLRPEGAMPIDRATAHHLELDGVVQLLDRAVTPLGSRRLRDWLNAPLTDVESIELRLGGVSELFSNESGRDRLQTALRGLGDLERLVSRAAQGHASARDLLALRNSLRAIPAVADATGGLDAIRLRALADRLVAPTALTSALDLALADEVPAGRDGGFIRPGYDPHLDGIREASREARDWIGGLEAGERERTGIRHLKVGYNRVSGYFIEVPHASADRVPAEYTRRQTLAGAERFLIPELKEKEALVLNADADIEQRERALLAVLCDRVAAEAVGALDCADAAGETDALASLASAAIEHRWVRPEVNDGCRLDIRAGRHPLVEAALPPGSFVPNDLVLDPGTDQIMLLTGPNMAGKSTFLRQAVLIVVMAQAGSFVPADSAVVGLADRVFTRVGAHDDLGRGLSTFMVEMTETASILNHATAASLVVFDEVGRGTSTYDGMSIAQAVVEYLHESPRLGCRTLFATHFHELTALADRLPRITNHRVEVAEEGETVRFLHRVVPGGADRSYGIHVAALAGLPSVVIARARSILGELETQRPLEPTAQQLGLPLAAAEDPVRQELGALEIDHLTPMDALQKLYELKGRLN